MDEKERWEQVCEPKLNSIEKSVQKLVKVVIDGNGVPGLVTRMAVLDKTVEGLVVSQQIPQQKSVLRKKSSTKIKAFGNEFSTDDPSVQNGVKIGIMLICLFVGIGALIYIVDHMNDTRSMLMAKITNVEPKPDNDR